MVSINGGTVVNASCCCCCSNEEAKLSCLSLQTPCNGDGQPSPRKNNVLLNKYITVKFESFSIKYIPYYTRLTFYIN